jgi:hypothetical protein
LASGGAASRDAASLQHAIGARAYREKRQSKSRAQHAFNRACFESAGRADARSKWSKTMKPKLMLAAMAAAITLTATPAASAAQWYGRGGGDIVVRHDAGTFRFDRGDREYRRLINRFGFRPGYRYEYTHDCDGYGCDVLVFEQGRRRPIDRFHAPYFRFAFAGNRVPGNYDEYGDNRWRDRRG